LLAQRDNVRLKQSRNVRLKKVERLKMKTKKKSILLAGLTLNKQEKEEVCPNFYKSREI